jgi:hypothetical protein
MDNFKSAELHSEALLAIFQEEEKLGRVRFTTLETLHQEYGDDGLRVGGLLAEEKGERDFRIILDMSHGVEVNPETFVRDQHVVPGLGEKHVILARARERSLTRIGLKSDVKDAHRTMKVARIDQGMQACRLADKVIVHQVGVQGCGSSAYHWSRLFGLVTRLILYMLLDDEAWILTYADDQDIFASGPRMIDNCVFIIFVSWKKSAGGFEYEWIGFAQDLGRFQLGISVRRASCIGLMTLLKRQGPAEGSIGGPGSFQFRSRGDRCH